MPTDLTPRDLKQLVLDRIAALGAEAPAHFGVSESTIANWVKGRQEPSLKAAQRAWDDDPICTHPEVWKSSGQENIAFLPPVYETIEPAFMFSAFGAMKQYGMEKITIIPRMRTLVDEARNDQVAIARRSGIEWFVMGDVDMIWPLGNAAYSAKLGHHISGAKADRNALVRLMSHPKEFRIVGALYKDRRSGDRAQCAKAFTNPAENARLLKMFGKWNAPVDGPEPDGLEDAGGWCALGLVRFHRSVFDEIEAFARQPGSPIANILPPPPPRDKEPVGFFGRTSQWRGEDIAACRRAEMCGIKTWLDTGLILGHVGRRVF
jgi:hypothetical protein